jgi:hypothetical protein
MLALVSVKALTLFGQAAMYLVIEHQGSPHGWNWVIYTFTALRGLLFFTVVVLIGTGWSHLSSNIVMDERTKQVLVLVLPLQVSWGDLEFVTELGPGRLRSGHSDTWLHSAQRRIMCVVMWGGRSFGLHTSKVRAKDRGHTYSLHRTHMGCLTWTMRAHVL